MLFRSAQRVLVAVVVLALAGAIPALATTYTVNSTADTIAVDGVITLREAITAAVTNAPAGDAPAGTPGLDTINFNIPGPGPHTIALTAPLPNITDPVLIDGFSQPGAVSGANPVLQIEVSAPTIFAVFEITSAGSSGSTIRGLAINGFQAFGIQIFESSNNTITSNYIELNPAGTATSGTPPPGGVGIIVGGDNNPANNNVIGGSGPGLGNVIATDAPGFAGIEVGANAPGTADGTVIRGNFIGTDKTGTVALGNPAAQGIVIVDATHTSIGGANGSPGGACSGDCNLMSGTGTGIDILGNVTDTTTISGNYLGTDVTGAVALPNPGGDILIEDSAGSITGAIAIGGATPAARNLISSSNIGIQINRNPAAKLTIQGNYIGTDRTGNNALGNGFGVYLNGTAGVKVGGVNAGEGNLISGNTNTGLALLGASGTIIAGNTVGPSAGGNAAPAGASAGNGVSIAGSLNNQIGAVAPGGAGTNIIAFNAYGVLVGGPSANNSIFSNSIFSNSVGAVTLLGGGAVNDHCDADTGPNQLQNFPVLNPVLATGGTMAVAGTLDSTGGQTFRIELFSNPPAGSPQATTPIGSTTVTTDPATCLAAFSVTLPAIALNSTITAIATDATGNSSQLSAPVLVLLTAIQVAKSFVPSSIKYLGSSQLTIALTNPNASVITGVAFNDIYPIGLANQAVPQASSSCGGTVTATPSGTSLALTGGSIPANGTCTVTVFVTANRGPTLVNTIGALGVTSANAAPSAAPATAALTVDISAIPALSLPGLAALAGLLAMIALLQLRKGA